jgi:hypothetical protein
MFGLDIATIISLLTLLPRIFSVMQEVMGNPGVQKLLATLMHEHKGIPLDEAHATVQGWVADPTTFDLDAERDWMDRASQATSG